MNQGKIHEPSLIHELPCHQLPQDLGMTIAPRDSFTWMGLPGGKALTRQPWNICSLGSWIFPLVFDNLRGDHFRVTTSVSCQHHTQTQTQRCLFESTPIFKKHTQMSLRIHSKSFGVWKDALPHGVHEPALLWQGPALRVPRPCAVAGRCSLSGLTFHGTQWLQVSWCPTNYGF